MRYGLQKIIRGGNDMWPTPEEAARLREKRIQMNTDININVIP